MKGANAGKYLPQEKQHIEATKKNPARFAPLYNFYYRPIFIFIFKKVRDEYTTEELTAKVFLKAMLNIKKYEHRGFPFSSWLYRIASNEVNMHYRSAKKIIEVEVMETDVVTLMEEIEEEDELNRQELVMKLMAELPLEVSQLIELRFFDRMSFKEIGEIHEITEGNAKIRVYRALDKLKKLVQENLA